MEPKNKVTIIGAGMVGSTAAYSLIASDFCEEVALIDVNKKFVTSQVMDLQHAVPLWGFTKVKVGDYQDIKDSKIVVITAGASQNVGMTRIDLLKTNNKILKQILPKVFRQNSKVVVIIVTNPVDILTYLAIKSFPKYKKQIMGSGTILDSARFRVLLGQELKVNPESVHAYIVGEHGDSEVPLWSTADIGSTPLGRYKKISSAKKKKIFNQAKNAAYAIIAGKQSTYYGIAAVINKLTRAIIDDKNTVFPVSHVMEGEFGINDIALSLPTIVGRHGVVKKVIPKISKTEIHQLKKSADKLKKVVKSI